MKYFIHFIGILIALSASRFLPHPPNFTSLIALSFYVPFLLGKKYIPALLVSFALTDFIIGYHLTTHWTWGSVLIIGLVANYFPNKIFFRIFGTLFGAIIFYLITNFGVWTTGIYNLTIEGLVTSYVLAIPFFGYTLLSTFLFSILIELSVYLISKFFKLNILKIS